MIGRVEEIQELRRAYASVESEFVAVYGRRRIGKTYLINEVFNARFTFHAVGMEKGKKREQLEAFQDSLKRQGWPKCPKLTSWIAAFSQLEQMLETSTASRKVVFLDELPWFDSPCSGFLAAFERFWNGWACLRKDILLIVCGSATTWIVDRVLKSRGGLHNRVTRRLHLEPFTLRECEDYAAYRGLGMDRKQILECYMALGGVAYYWTLLQEGISAAQNFDRMFFGEFDEMREEFNRVFASLYRSPTMHIAIVRILGALKTGMTRDEIVRNLGTESSGDVTECLKELVQCGFVRHCNAIGKAKYGGLYQLVDPYCLFYFEFLERRRGNDSHYWTRNYNSPKVNGWRGRAFERVCFWHVSEIKARLGISGIEADVYSWQGRADEVSEKVQIDLLIDRADGVVDVCEIKYSDEPYELKKDENENIARRVSAFRELAHQKKSVRTVLIASSGLKSGKYNGNIMAVVTGEDLFARQVY